MSTDIYYFTGTGNSLFAARQLMKTLTDKVDIKPIKDFTEHDKFTAYSLWIGCLKSKDKN